jgi:hypothetical protein
MAITILQSPQAIMPAYNPIILAVTSTNQTKPGFQFVFDIFSAGTSNHLARIKLPQNPDGYGVTDIHRILENYVTYDIQPTATGITNALGSRYKYDIKIGEEYQFYWEFNQGQNFFGYQVLSSTTMQHYFPAGISEVDINSTVTSINGVRNFAPGSNMDGVALVLYDAATASSGFSGTMIYSDYRKTIFSGLNTISGLYVNNAAIPFDDFRSYTYGTYNAISSTGNFFTNCPDEYEVRTSNRIWFNFYSSLYTGTSLVLEVATYDAQGINEGVYVISGTSANNDLYQKAGVGPWNLANSNATALIGALPIIKSTTARYELALAAPGTLTLRTVPKSFILNQSCSRYEIFDLEFMDRKGSMVSKSFELANKQSIDIVREEFKKQTGYFNGSSWTYNNYDRGRTNLSTNIKRKYTLTSNWITETDAAYMEELFSSPEVYWNDNGVLKAVIVTSNNYEIKQRVTSRLFNITIDLEMANNDDIQRS